MRLGIGDDEHGDGAGHLDAGEVGMASAQRARLLHAVDGGARRSRSRFSVTARPARRSFARRPLEERRDVLFVRSPPVAARGLVTFSMPAICETSVLTAPASTSLPAAPPPWRHFVATMVSPAGGIRPWRAVAEGDGPGRAVEHEVELLLGRGVEVVACGSTAWRWPVASRLSITSESGSTGRAGNVKRWSARPSLVAQHLFGLGLQVDRVDRVGQQVLEPRRPAGRVAVLVEPDPQPVVRLGNQRLQQRIDAGLDLAAGPRRRCSRRG